jgi:hypothetical protein
MMRTLRMAGFAALLLFFAGCGFPRNPWKPAEPSTPRPMVISTLAAETLPTTAPSGTPAAPAIGACAWVWANQELIDLTGELARAFQDEGLSGLEIRASAYGENCLDPQTNQVVRFAAMQTDFYLVIAVEDTADHRTAGEWIARSLKVLEPFVPGKVPGPNPGYIGIRFVSATGEDNLWFQRAAAEDFLKSVKNGSELYDALR